MSDPGVRLHARAAAVGSRLAELLAATLQAQQRDWADAIAFLRGLADDAGVRRWRAPAESGTDPEPLDRLVARFELAPVEAELLLLAGLPEEHEGYASVLRLLHPRGEPRPTTGLAAQIFCRSTDERIALRRLLERGPAVGSGALRLGDDGPSAERSLLPADGLWSALGGIEAWPHALQVRRDVALPYGLEEWLDTVPVRRAMETIAADRRVVVAIGAEDTEIGIARALALVNRARRDAAVGRPPVAPRDEDERTFSVHCVAHDLVPVLGLAREPGEPVDPPRPWLETHPGTVVVVGRPGAPFHSRRPFVSLPLTRLSPVARARAWEALVPGLAHESATLAVRYALESVQIAALAADLSISDDSGPTLGDVALAVRARSAVELGAGMALLHPAVGWESLVLTDDRMAQLHEAVARLRHQTTVFDLWGFPDGRPGSRGVRLLFAGPPGTGKSLAAEAMAAELGLDLLTVDLSRLVSKWLGETEKNLARVFDRAERIQAVLLFDEADALFAKRTEVADAHDRYANLETAYLLSRLERFDGLAILATNLKDQIDPAFIRRLECIIDFEEPGAQQRERLWQAHLPPRAPVAEDVVLAELAELYPIAGGLIRNASLAAAFLATADGGTITRHHLFHAVHREYEKAGRAFPGVPEGCA
jgi:hypothetical protein